MEDKEKKTQQGLSDAARRRAEDAKKARELRKQALAELEAEDKRRAAELLEKETGATPVKPQNSSGPQGFPGTVTVTEPEEKKPIVSAEELLEKDPKEAIRALLEEKGANKEDLDAYAAGQNVNSHLERILEAFGGRDAYKKNIAEFSLNDPREAEQRLVNTLSMMDVSEIAVLVKNHYKKEAAKIAEQKNEEKIEKIRKRPWRVSGPVMKVLQHAYAVAGIFLLSRPKPEKIWIASVIAFVVYMFIMGIQGGLLGRNAKNPKGYSVILPLIFAGISLFAMEKLRKWLWYAWISRAFYRVICFVLMGVFAVIGTGIFTFLTGLIEAPQNTERK